MITRLVGTLAEVDLTEITVDVHGVGYEVLIPMSTYDRLPPAGGEVCLHIHTHVREDILRLYGFWTKEERALFRLLITTANGVNQSLAAPGGPCSTVNASVNGPCVTLSGSYPATQVANQITSVHSKAFNAASLLTDGFDLEASYQFDLEDYDIPGKFVVRSLANHVSKFISDTGIAGTQRNVELAGQVSGGGGSATYNQSGGNVLTWKLQEVQSYQNDVWGASLTERWYAGGTFTNKNAIVCAVGTCPASSVQSPTINFNKVSSIMYLDVGLNWNTSDKTQLYARVDNAANTRPPDTGSNVVNDTLYDVIGRMYRIGVRFNN